MKLTVIFMYSIFLSSGFLSFGETNKNQSFPPRGSNVESSAGHCSLGPFGKSGDVGKYEGLCNRLTHAEKCLGYLKQHVGDEGDLGVAYDTAKATFCLRSVLGNIVK